MSNSNDESLLARIERAIGYSRLRYGRVTVRNEFGCFILWVRTHAQDFPSGSDETNLYVVDVINPATNQLLQTRNIEEQRLAKTVLLSMKSIASQGV